MNPSEYRRRHWNESKWEKEIRRDERRIHSYFGKLSSCLDLPGEEEMIFSQLKSDRDLVPVGCNLESMRSWCYSNLADEEEDEAPRRPGGEAVDMLDYLASEWNFALAIYLPIEFQAEALGISCGYGKLLARAIDFIDSDPETEMALKISLGKRVLSDLSEVLSFLKKLRAQLAPEIAVLPEYHTQRLWEVRTVITDLLGSLQNK